MDLRTLLPLDRETILESVRRTNKLLVVHEDTRTGGIAGEIAALVTETAFDDLGRAHPARHLAGYAGAVFAAARGTFSAERRAHRRGRARTGAVLNQRLENRRTMAVEVVMPQMGESIFEGTITKWLKKPGDSVERDEPLFEISTDKVDAEIPSPAAGVLREIKVTEGQTVPIQTVVAVIDSAEASAAVKLQRRRSARKLPVRWAAAPFRFSSRINRWRKHSGVYSCAYNPRNSRSAADSQFAAGAAHGAREQHRSPRFAAPAPAGASASRISWRPSPQGGAATGATAAGRKCRAQHATLETAVPRERIYFGRYQVQPMSVMRQRIAEHMVLSKRVSPHVYSIDEADMTRIVALRARR